MGRGVKPARWAVRCEFYTTPDRTSQEAAERLLASIAAAGNCSGEHEVIEVAP